MQRMGQHMHLGVFPTNQLSVNQIFSVLIDMIFLPRFVTGSVDPVYFTCLAWRSSSGRKKKATRFSAVAATDRREY